MARRKKCPFTLRGGVRIYHVERDPRRADEVAALADRMVVDGCPMKDVIALLWRHADIFPAVAARMLRFARVFQVGGWDLGEEGDVVFLSACAADIPPEVARSFEHQRRLGAERCRRALAALASSRPVMPQVFRAALEACEWLVPRIFQDDVFISAGEELRHAMVCELDRLAEGVRIPFVAQIVTSSRVPHEWKVRCYRAAQTFMTMDETFFAQAWPHGEKLEGRLLGREALFYGAFRGLTSPYGDGDSSMWRNHGSGFSPRGYMFAVNRDVQTVFADLPLIRYVYARNRFPGYELVRASFRNFAKAADEPHVEHAPRKAFEEISARDLPENFMMRFDMLGLDLTRYMVGELIRKGMVEILCALVRERTGQLEDVIAFDEFVLYLSSSGRWGLAKRVVQEIEAVRPGLTAQIVDCFGNTPLWYTHYAYASGNVSYEEDMDGEDGLETVMPALGHTVRLCEAYDAYVDYLESVGVDPRRRNHLGFTFEEMRCWEDE